MFPVSLSYRDVEDLLTERGVDVSYETIRRWALKFGQAYARKLRQSLPRPDNRWHLDEMFSSINGKRMYLWRAVDSEGEVLDILVQSRRNKKAALKLMRAQKVKPELNHIYTEHPKHTVTGLDCGWYCREHALHLYVLGLLLKKSPRFTWGTSFFAARVEIAIIPSGMRVTMHGVVLTHALPLTQV